MLTLALRDLAADNLISRHVKSTLPLEVEYVLTDIGKQLIPALMEVRKWGIAYQNYLRFNEQAHYID